MKLQKYSAMSNFPEEKVEIEEIISVIEKPKEI
jgi:hypothetical protein